MAWSENDLSSVLPAIRLISPAAQASGSSFLDGIWPNPADTASHTDRDKKLLGDWLANILAGDFGPQYAEGCWQIGCQFVESAFDRKILDDARSSFREQATQLLGDNEKAAWSAKRLLDLDLILMEYVLDLAADVAKTGRQKSPFDQLAASLAHELRHPLHVIGTSAYFLSHGTNLATEKVAEHLSRIQRQIDLAQSMITTLTNFAKLDTPEMDQVEIGRLIDHVFDMVELPETVQLTVDGAANDVVALGDLAQLQIVLSNLVRNAIDAMPDGGELTLTIKPAADHIVISVTDTGSGIEPEHLSQIMTPMFTTKTRGLGLGLSLVRSMVENHGGQIEISSQPGRGTCFTIRLPAAPLP